MKLHIGCGTIHLDGYVNIDIQKSNATDVVEDALTLTSRYKPSTIDEIYSCHMLEHLTKKEGIAFIIICNKLLKPRGLLRLELPMVDLIIDKFDLGIQDEEWINNFYGQQRHPGDFHKYGYTTKTIRIFLEKYGFHIEKMIQGRTGYGPNSPGVKIWARKNI